MADRPIKIVLVDDSDSYAETFRREARKRNIKVEHFLSAEEAKRHLEDISEKTIAGIVLDVKGLAEAGDGVPDRSYFPKAFMDLSYVAPNIKIYGLTGETDTKTDWAEHYKSVTKIYEKGKKGEEQLLSQIKEDAGKLDHIRILNKHKNTFNILEKLNFQTDIINDLINVINSADNGTLDVKQCLGSLRNILESVFQKINGHAKSIVPDEHVANEVSVRRILTHFRDNGLLSSRNDYFYKSLDMAYTCMCDFGSHNPQSKDYYGSIYKAASENSVKLCLHSVIEAIEWCDQVIQSQTSGGNA